MEAAAVRQTDKAGDYRFEPGGDPLNRLRVTLPEPNTLVPAQVRRACRRSALAVARDGGVLYRLTHDGREIVNADLDLDGSWEQWLLRLDRAPGVGSGHAPDRGRLGPAADRVRRARREPVSTRLRRRSGEPADLPIQTLVPGWRSDEEPKAAAATAGPQQTSAGPRALRATPDYKTWALWASLALGVLLLAWMAWILAREMKDSGPKP